MRFKLCFVLCVIATVIKAEVQPTVDSPNLVVARDVGVFDLDEEVQSFQTVEDRNGMSAFYEADHRALVAGIEFIDFYRLHPSRLAVFGPKAFTIVSNKKGQANLAAARFGDGKVIAYGRKELSRMTKTGIQPFFENALKWMTGKEVADIKVASSSDILIAETAATQTANVNAQSLSGYDVYILDGQNEISATDREAILSFVQNGGGLFVGAQAWSWMRHNGIDEISNSFPANQILTKMGIMITFYDRDARTSPTSPMPELERNLYYALINLGTSQPTDVAKSTLFFQGNTCLSKVTITLPEFQELADKAAEIFLSLDMTNPDHHRLKIHNDLATTLLKLFMYRGKVPKSATVTDFPYDVPANAKRVSKTIAVNGNYSGYPHYFGFANAGRRLWISTGLYAAAGDFVTVTAPQEIVDTNKSPDFGVQIGCHSDRLYKRTSDLDRSPDIITHFSITGSVTKVASMWGGLIYITIPRGASLGSFEVTIENAVESPRYVLGQTTTDQWQEIRNSPAPWAEYEVPNQIILSFPSKWIRNVADPFTVVDYYSQIMTDVNYMSGFDNNIRVRAERIVLDKQISNGWMHSGYPIMGYITNTGLLKEDYMINSGMWGVIHELGHNHQHKSYTFPRVIQTGCNIWALHGNRKIFNFYHWSGIKEKQDPLITNWVLRGKRDSEYEVWLAFISYVVLLEEIGWDVWPKVNKKFYALPVIHGSDEEKMDALTRVLCEASKVNVAPYFEWWNYNLSDETKSVCNAQKAMRVLTDRYDSIDHTTVTEHGTCQEGWVPYGDACFFFSTEKVNWYNAEEKCNEAGGQLASCLTSKEAYFLKHKLEEYGLKEMITVGINTLQLDKKPRYFDGNVVDNILPWNRKQPGTQDGRRCASFHSYELYMERCTRPSRFICKKGGSTCSAKWKCPKGWIAHSDKCYWVNYGGGRYEQALADCASKNANLFSVDTVDENNWLVDLFKDIRWRGQYYWRSYWLGLNATTQMWTNGEPLTYPGNWCEGHSISGSGEQFAMSANSYCWAGGVNPRRREAWLCEKGATLA